MTTVAVVGAGDIGGAAARALAALDCVDRVLVYDDDAKAAAGKALDIQQAGAIEGFHTTLVGTGSPSSLIGCAACVLADRFTDSREWAEDEGLAMLRALTPLLGVSPIIFAGARQTSLLALAADELRLDPRRLIGSAPEGFASATRSLVAMQGDCSPHEVQAAIYGRPPDGLVVAWTDATIGGQPLQTRLTQVQVAKLETLVPRLWPPGPYALGAAAAKMVAATVASSRQSHTILTVLAGEFGIRHGVGVVAAQLGSPGVVRTISPVLSAREQVQVVTALVGSGERGLR